MYPPIFQLLSQDGIIQSIFGTSPCRVHMFGSAPQSGTPAHGLPYCVWQTVSGLPENYLDKTPDIDSLTTQIDIYASTAADARNGALAVRDVLELSAYVTNWRGESKDEETNNYRVSFDVAWFVDR